MRNSKLKFILAAATLAGSVALFSSFAHGEGEGMMAGHSDHHGMMSSQGMDGMGSMMGMMHMMSDMSPEDRAAMMESCMKMMQSHAGDATHSDTEDNGSKAR